MRKEYLLEDELKIFEKMSSILAEILQKVNVTHGCSLPKVSSNICDKYSTCAECTLAFARKRAVTNLLRKDIKLRKAFRSNNN